MLVPLPQSFAVDRGSIRGGSEVATPTPRRDDRGRSGPVAPRSTAEAAGTSSSGASSEISPTRAGTTFAASEYDDCPRDLDDLNAAARELGWTPSPFIKNLATATADEGDRACVRDGSRGAACPEGQVCADALCLWPAP